MMDDQVDCHLSKVKKMNELVKTFGPKLLDVYCFDSVSESE